ncbi:MULTISPECIES: hypothetical protein [unclassified Microbulbifer]|uniref:hypothetical protein n=1 Tax=unclassified Microbulbifer TaxID=2619833 RepID=UPI001E49D760|nr:hypothetical protein [Microbulbifer sp. YPW16]UHQ53675.1 hypothetical protein LVE68_09115 [Microbulbifer sp. YPW16]
MLNRNIVRAGVLATFAVTIAISGGCASPGAPVAKPTGHTSLSCQGDPAVGVIASDASHRRLAAAFFREGSRFQLRNLYTEETQVLFDGKPIFEQCSGIARTIDSEARAREILRLAGTGHWQKLVGTRVFACRNDRAGWFFFLKEPGGFIGYAGKRQLPVFLVGMQCEPDQ